MSRRPPAVPKFYLTRAEDHEELQLQPRRPRLAYVPVRVADIIRETALRHGLQITTLRSHVNMPECVTARRDAAHQLRALGYSYPQIGRWLGGFNHTTIMNLVRRNGWPVPAPPAATPASKEIPCPDLSGEWAI